MPPSGPLALLVAVEDVLTTRAHTKSMEVRGERATALGVRTNAGSGEERHESGKVGEAVPHDGGWTLLGRPAKDLVYPDGHAEKGRLHDADLQVRIACGHATKQPVCFQASTGEYARPVMVFVQPW